MKISNGDNNGNENANQTQKRDDSQNPIPNRNYGPFDFEINQEFIEENKKINPNLVRHRQNYKHKFAPFTKVPEKKEKDGSLQTPFRTWGARNKNSRADEGR